MAERVVRLFRADVTAASLSPSSPVGVLISGGGFVAWKANHPTAQFLLRYVPVVYSLLLPYHGHQAATPYGGTEEEINASVDDLCELVRPLVLRRYVVFAGYSMGGLYCSRLYPRLLACIHPQSLVLLVGVVLRLGDSGPLIERYWQDLMARKPQSLARTHTAQYATTIRFINAACSQPASPLFPAATDRCALRRGHAYFVAGRADGAFPLADLRRTVDEEGWEAGGGGGGAGQRQRVWEVGCGHFDYFSGEHWPAVSAALAEIVRLHGRADLLLPLPAAGGDMQTGSGEERVRGEALRSAL